MLGLLSPHVRANIKTTNTINLLKPINPAFELIGDFNVYAYW